MIMKDAHGEYDVSKHHIAAWRDGADVTQSHCRKVRSFPDEGWAGTARSARYTITMVGCVGLNNM